jgi:hypothetical protein
MEEDFLELLKSAAEETGHDLGDSARSVAIYATERAAHLSLIVNEPGFMKAVIAERDNVAMFAALEVGKDAKASDQRIVGIIHGALMLAAKSLASA